MLWNFSSLFAFNLFFSVFYPLYFWFSNWARFSCCELRNSSKYIANLGAVFRNNNADSFVKLSMTFVKLSMTLRHVRTHTYVYIYMVKEGATITIPGLNHFCNKWTYHGCRSWSYVFSVKIRRQTWRTTRMSNLQERFQWTLANYMWTSFLQKLFRTSF